MPKDLVEAAGCTQWRWKLAETLTEARRRLLEAVAKTDQLIADLRAGQTSTTIQQNKQPRALATALLAGKPPSEVFESDYFHGTPQEAEALSQLPPVQLAGNAPFTAAAVIELNLKLKNTISPATAMNWERGMKNFTKFLGHHNLHLLTKEDCQKYRDHLITTAAVSTLKQRMGLLAGLLELAVEEGHLSFNPARGLTKRLEEPKVKPLKVFDRKTDLLVHKMAPWHQDFYWLVRWSGMRAAEAAGLELENINLDDQVIHLVYLKDRPLKTKYLVRDIPIHPNHFELCKTLVD